MTNPKNNPMHLKRLKRGFSELADVRSRSIVDPVTGCWHWQGAKTNGMPRLHAFDHHLGDKRTMNGTLAVWNIAFGESPAPYLVFRGCMCSDCVNPVHLRRARDKAEIGPHIRRAGTRKGIAVEARRANILLAQIATGRIPTAPDVVLAIRAAGPEVTGRALARQHGLSDQTVSRIRNGQSHRHLLEVAQ